MVPSFKATKVAPPPEPTLFPVAEPPPLYPPAAVPLDTTVPFPPTVINNFSPSLRIISPSE